MYTFKKEPMTTNAQVHNEVNKVYKTNDLSIFQAIDGNRVVNPQHVKRLCDSIRINGMLCNPILVNEKLEVIDGQHRLHASSKVNSHIYYIILKNYDLKQVHTLNLNQKNWTKKDFMDGYADMGLLPYLKLKSFVEKNSDFAFTDCIALCSNITSGSNFNSNKIRSENKTEVTTAQIFEEGTWIGKNFELGQEWASKIKLVQPYYTGCFKRSFVTAMIGLLQNKSFDFNEFMHKVRLQPTALVDCATTQQMITLIEDIYNYRSRNKVNLRY